VLGDDEMTGGAGDVFMPSIVTSNVGTTSVNLRPRRRSRPSQ
jgi:hypothetical protein